MKQYYNVLNVYFVFILNFHTNTTTNTNTTTLTEIHTEAGKVVHECESELVCLWSLMDKVPYFNAGVYLENKRKIGKVDEILGKVTQMYFTIKMDPGVVAKSFQPNDLVYIGTDKLLPLSRFTNPGTYSMIKYTNIFEEFVIFEVGNEGYSC